MTPPPATAATLFVGMTIENLGVLALRSRDWAVVMRAELLPIVWQDDDLFDGLWAKHISLIVAIH